MLLQSVVFQLKQLYRQNLASTLSVVSTPFSKRPVLENRLHFLETDEKIDTTLITVWYVATQLSFTQLSVQTEIKGETANLAPSKGSRIYLPPPLKLSRCPNMISTAICQWRPSRRRAALGVAHHSKWPLSTALKVQIILTLTWIVADHLKCNR